MVVEFKSVTLTGHAKAKMRDRDVSPEQLALVLTHPQIVEPSRGQIRMVREDLCAVVALDEDGEATVITILLRQLGQWSDEDMLARD